MDPTISVTVRELGVTRILQSVYEVVVQVLRTLGTDRPVYKLM
jgi:hypothetical protein